VLDARSDVRQRDTSLTRFAPTAMPREHIPHSSRHSGRVSDISLQVVIVTTTIGRTAIVRDQRTAPLTFRHRRKSLLE
jgi:hypothetical protein